MNKEWLLSSAALLLALILIRAVFGKKMRPGFRYALWGLALIRLLLPVTLFHTNISPADIAEDIVRPLTTSETVYETLEKPVYAGTMTDTTLSMPEAELQHPGEIYKIQGYPTDGEKGNQHTYFFRDSLKNVLSRLLPKIWLAGVCVTAAVFLFQNVRFAAMLRKRRVRLETECKLPVYAAEGLDSSCLFLRRIYVSPETAADEAWLRHVLAHELSHFRHGDGLWALLRCAALALHWFDPLCWWAASLSRQDSELWADAGALRKLGDEAWEDYGKTLITLSTGMKKNVPLLTAATAMCGGKKAIRERVAGIAQRKRLPVYVAVLALLIGLIAAGCAFTGVKAQTEPTVLTGTKYEMTALYQDDYVREIKFTNNSLRLEPSLRGDQLTLKCVLTDGDAQRKFTVTGQLLSVPGEDGRKLILGSSDCTDRDVTVRYLVLADGIRGESLHSVWDRDLPARLDLRLHTGESVFTFTAPLPEAFFPCFDGTHPECTDAALVQTVQELQKSQTHSLTIAQSEGGSFPAGYAANILGEHALGEAIRLMVRPDPGWRFDHWELSAGEVDKPNSSDATFTMPDCDAEIKPVFVPTGKVDIAVSVPAGGSVKVYHTDENGNETMYGVTAGMIMPFYPGETVTLVADVADGYAFAGWVCKNGVFSDAYGLTTEYTVPDTDDTISAVFREIGGEALDIPENTPSAPVTVENWLDWASDLYGAETLEVLSEAEVQSWNEWFLEDWHRMSFLTSLYRTPAEIDLYELFYLGVGHIATGEDIRAYLTRFGEWRTECPTDVMSRSEMDAFLRKYTGFGLDDTVQKEPGYVYLPESDCYYHSHGDTNIPGMSLTGGVKRGDEVILFYERYVIGCEFCCVTLDVSGDTPLFVKNVLCETDGAGHAAEAAYPIERDAFYTPPEADVQIIMPPVREYRSYDAAMEALGAQTMLLNGKEVPFERVPDCGVTYHYDGSLERYPVNGGDPVYGEFRDGDTVVPALYFVYADGRVLDLPIPETPDGPCRMVWNDETNRAGAYYVQGEGDFICWSCHRAEGGLMDTGEYRGVRYTLFIPTGEVFFRLER